MRQSAMAMWARIQRSINEALAAAHGLGARCFAATFLGSVVAISPVWADDTEIFFGTGGAGNVAPNLLLIVDTSGSMRNEVSGTGKTRMQNVQDALRTLLNNLNNVNVGLMRFSNPGGPVLYQIDNLDRNVNEARTETVDVTATIEANSDDAQQPYSAGGELEGGDALVVDSDRLQMVRMSTGSSGIYTREVQDGDDDVEQRLTKGKDNIKEDDNRLELTNKKGEDKNLQAVGVRFAGTTVPKDATITNAYITFKVAKVGEGGIARLRISGERGTSVRFDKDTDNDITRRSQTSAGVFWDLEDTAKDAIVSTPSLTAVVQEIVEQSDWEGDGTGNTHMTFFFERRPSASNISEHIFQAYEEGDFVPTLTVEYTTGSIGEANTLTGLRFSGVDVPRGVTITSAYLDFSVVQTDSAEETSLAIAGELDSNPATYSEANSLKGRLMTSARVAWDAIPEWNTPDETQTSPDIKSVVQEIVNQGDWCGGNPMAFLIGGTGLRSAWARDADNGLQPVLRVSYDAATIAPGTSCARASASMQITNDDDEVEEQGTDVWTRSEDLDFSNNRSTGLRFPGINIPPGAKVLNAHLEFSSWSDYSGNTTIKVQAQGSDDAEPFSNSNGTVDSRSWGAASDWDISDDWAEWQWVRTHDLAAQVQSVVDRSGWAMGNAMAFRLRKSDGATRAAIAYNYDPVYAPRLVVEYQDDGTAAAEIRTVRQEILEQVDQLNTRGYTPVQDTLYEAALYYTGGNVDYGAYRGGPNDSGPHAYTRVSANGTMVPGTFTNNYPDGCTAENLGADACKNETLVGVGGSPQYQTPIVDWCQKENHIILLTDGSANRPHSEEKIKSFIGDSTCDNSVQTSEACVKELVNYLYTRDQSDLKEKQIVRTHTIGFNFSSQWLADVAEAGGGRYKEANQAADLVAEVQDILSDVLKVNNTFVAPVAAINQFNRLNHRSEIYFAVFRPEETPNWPGNLKKYRLGGTAGTILDYSTGEGEPAIDPVTGYFTTQAQSAWGGVVDGPEVDVGGANKMMPAYSARKIYTHYAGSSSDTLSDAVNVLATDNGNLTRAMFGVEGMTDAEFATHIDWIRGRDVDDEDGNASTDENRYIVGDPLHSKPVAVTYGGTEQEPDITVYFGSNSGFLHAVNAATGVERFAFLPQDSFKKQSVLREFSTSSSHVYGIDGSITAWVNDKNNDGSISGEGEFVRLFFGQRRGGRNYYAMDVTDRDRPRMMWQIRGGAGDFAELGQSWASPIRGRLNINGVARDVLYISGGYDPDQDDADIRVVDNQGAAIFIVDALTGELIWKGGNGTQFTEDFDDMNYSIPGDMAVVDITNSGFDNMLFVGDVGGQVWRFDISNGAAIDNLITGGVIADLGVADGTNTVENNRRFYHSPDVGLVVKDGDQKLAVAIGSGFQAHPLSTGNADRFYMILQDDVFSPPEGAIYRKLTHDNLYDATDNDVGENVEGSVELLDSAEGYYFDIPRAGEKVLSTPLIFNNMVTFTTYEPNPTRDTSRCIPTAGVTRVYQVGLLDAAPVNNWDDIDGLTENDRDIELKTTSIVDEPVIICTSGACQIYLGPETPPSDLATQDRIFKTFWRKE